MSDIDPKYVHGRIGDGTPYAATFTMSRVEGEDGISWRGSIHFDNNQLNQAHIVKEYKTGEPIPMWYSWSYFRIFQEQSVLQAFLIEWHADLVALFERVKALK